jgi:hypothetical protein
MVCERHSNGCGFSLKPGDVIFIDAGQCRFYRGIWYVSCRKLDSDGNRTCKVGYVKVPADMMHLVGNRIGIVSSIHVRDIDHIEIRSRTMVVTKRDKKKKSEATQPDDAAKKKHTPGKTLDLCSCVHDYALIHMLDGGVPSFLGASSPHSAQPSGGGGDSDDDDDDDGESDDVDSISSLESVVRKPAKKKKSTESNKRSGDHRRKKSNDGDSLSSQEKKPAAKKKKTSDTSKQKSAGGKKKNLKTRVAQEGRRTATGRSECMNALK